MSRSLAAITTISSGKTMRMPKTAMMMPGQKAMLPFRRHVFQLVGVDDGIVEGKRDFRTASTAQMKNTLSMPPMVPSVRQPSHRPSIRPMTVTIKAQRKYPSTEVPGRAL